MSKSPPRPTDAELQILQELWRLGPATVKQVHQSMGGHVAYTTILKLLQIMTEKGIVRRNEEARAHVYDAVASQEETQQALVKGLLSRAFGGSASQLVMQALSTNRATPDELNQIKKLIKRLSKEDK